jgi:hypothetical protein
VTTFGIFPRRFNVNLLFQKTERNKFIYYGIGDDTGKMEVVVYGRLTNVRCEPGSKLRLVCFELTSTEDGWQLRSVRHSYMQVRALGNTSLPKNHILFVCLFLFLFLFFVCCLFVCLLISRQGFAVQPLLSWNLLCRPGWTETQK